jgi:hypothetical protein
MAVDTATAAHLEWLGYVQPTGIVVSVSALMEAQLHNESSRFIPLQQQLYSVLPEERGEVLPRLDSCTCSDTRGMIANNARDRNDDLLDRCCDIAK